MSLFKNKYFLPFCLLGVISGYFVADNVIKNHLPPMVDAPTLKYDVLTALGQQPHYYRQTVSGNYLAGKHAQTIKDWDKAYEYIGRVLIKEPDNLDLKKHTMVLAMEYGDVKEAQKLADDIIAVQPDNVLAVLFSTITDFKEENYQTALNKLNLLEQNQISNLLTPALKMWVQSSIGKVDLSALPLNSFYAYHALMIYHHITPDPELLNYALRAYDPSEVDIRDAERFADLLALSEQIKQALPLYEQILKTGFGSETLEEKIDALNNNEPVTDLVGVLEANNVREGAAVVYNNMASILFREYSDDSATIFAQMSLYLDPDMDTNRIIIASIKSRNERYDDAIEILSQIKPESENYILSRRQIAELEAEKGNKEEAIATLESLYADQDNLDALIQAADIYRLEEDFAKSVELYTKVIDQVIAEHGEITKDYWHVAYARGMSYERLKEYKKSEDDLLLALKFKPNDPYILNYLGYSWADQGVNLEQSLDMISRAVQAQPEDGYIADSLGWVLYKMNKFEEAIPHLERAVELLAYDATLNDHLGDAYWQVGRRNEAKFQWQRAYNYSEPNEEDLKISIEEKLVHGIDVITDKPKSILSNRLLDDEGV